MDDEIEFLDESPVLTQRRVMPQGNVLKQSMMQVPPPIVPDRNVAKKHKPEAMVKPMVMGSRDMDYTCSLCHKALTDRDETKRHIGSVHLNWSPFECFRCGMKFVLNIDLVHHWAVKHPSENFRCVMDDEKYAEMDMQLEQLTWDSCNQKPETARTPIVLPTSMIDSMTTKTSITTAPAPANIPAFIHRTSTPSPAIPGVSPIKVPEATRPISNLRCSTPAISDLGNAANKRKAPNQALRNAINREAANQSTKGSPPMLLAELNAAVVGSKRKLPVKNDDSDAPIVLSDSEDETARKPSPPKRAKVEDSARNRQGRTRTRSTSRQSAEPSVLPGIEVEKVTSRTFSGKTKKSLRRKSPPPKEPSPSPEPDSHENFDDDIPGEEVYDGQVIEESFSSRDKEEEEGGDGTAVIDLASSDSEQDDDEDVNFDDIDDDLMEEEIFRNDLPKVKEEFPRQQGKNYGKNRNQGKGKRNTKHANQNQSLGKKTKTISKPQILANGKKGHHLRNQQPQTTGKKTGKTHKKAIVVSSDEDEALFRRKKPANIVRGTFSVFKRKGKYHFTLQKSARSSVRQYEQLHAPTFLKLPKISPEEIRKGWGGKLPGEINSIKFDEDGRLYFDEISDRECNLCGDIISWVALETHATLHREFECPICHFGDKFSIKHDFIRHVKNHGKRPVSMKDWFVADWVVHMQKCYPGLKEADILKDNAFTDTAIGYPAPRKPGQPETSDEEAEPETSKHLTRLQSLRKGKFPAKPSGRASSPEILSSSDGDDDYEPGREEDIEFGDMRKARRRWTGKGEAVSKKGKDIPEIVVESDEESMEPKKRLKPSEIEKKIADYLGKKQKEIETGQVPKIMSTLTTAKSPKDMTINRHISLNFKIPRELPRRLALISDIDPSTDEDAHFHQSTKYVRGKEGERSKLRCFKCEGNRPLREGENLIAHVARLHFNRSLMGCAYCNVKWPLFNRWIFNRHIRKEHLSLGRRALKGYQDFRPKWSTDFGITLRECFPNLDESVQYTTYLCADSKADLKVSVLKLEPKKIEFNFPAEEEFFRALKLESLVQEGSNGDEKLPSRLMMRKKELKIDSGSDCELTLNRSSDEDKDEITVISDKFNVSSKSDIIDIEIIDDTSKPEFNPRANPGKFDLEGKKDMETADQLERALIQLSGREGSNNPAGPEQNPQQTQDDHIKMPYSASVFESLIMNIAADSNSQSTENIAAELKCLTEVASVLEQLLYDVSTEESQVVSDVLSGVLDSVEANVDTPSKNPFSDESFCEITETPLIDMQSIADAELEIIMESEESPEIIEVPSNSQLEKPDDEEIAIIEPNPRPSKAVTHEPESPGLATCVSTVPETGDPAHLKTPNSVASSQTKETPEKTEGEVIAPIAIAVPSSKDDGSDCDMLPSPVESGIGGDSELSANESSTFEDTRDEEEIQVSPMRKNAESPKEKPVTDSTKKTSSPILAHIKTAINESPIVAPSQELPETGKRQENQGEFVPCSLLDFMADDDDDMDVAEIPEQKIVQTSSDETNDSNSEIPIIAELLAELVSRCCSSVAEEETDSLNPVENPKSETTSDGLEQPSKEIGSQSVSESYTTSEEGNLITESHDPIKSDEEKEKVDSIATKNPATLLQLCTDVLGDDPACDDVPLLPMETETEAKLPEARQATPDPETCGLAKSLVPYDDSPVKAPSPDAAYEEEMEREILKSPTSDDSGPKKSLIENKEDMMDFLNSNDGDISLLD